MTQSTHTGAMRFGLLAWLLLGLTLGLAGAGRAQAPYNGTLQGSPAFVTDTGFGQAVSLDGSTQYIKLPDPGPLTTTASSSYTWEARVNTTVASGTAIFISQINAAFNVAGYVYLASGVPTFIPNGATAVLTASGGSIADGNWHTIAVDVTAGSPATARIYVDGTLKGTSTFTEAASQTGASWLGQMQTTSTGPSFQFNGQIDEVRISNIARYTASTYTVPTAPFTTDSNTLGLYHLDGNATDTSVATAALAAANPTFAFTAAGVPTFTVAATGGTGTLNYQWYRSTTPGFAAGASNLLTNVGGVTGATTATLTDASALTAGVTYYYRAVVTDSASTPVVVTSTQRPFLAGLQPPLKIVAIGDSQSVAQVEDNYVAAITTTASLLATARGQRAVSVVNAAVAGSTSQSWLPNSTALNNAISAAGGSLAGYWVFYRIGVNDGQVSRSTSDFQTNMVSTLNALSAQGVAGVLLSYSLPREPGLYGEDNSTVFSESITPLVLSYQGVMNGLVGSGVYLGDTKSYSYFNLYPQTNFYYGTSPYSATGPQGAIHPNQIGAAEMGANEAAALLSILYPSTATRISGEIGRGR